MPILKKKTAEATKAPAAKKEAKPLVQDKKKVMTARASASIIAPVMTEKAAKLASDGVYSFFIPNAADRVSVREAFVARYGVMPTRVNVLRTHGKEKRTGGFLSRRPDRKKALVTVKTGTKLDIYSA